ncbi:MAG: chemotaxis protein CheW [bacterium]
MSVGGELATEQALFGAAPRHRAVLAAQRELLLVATAGTLLATPLTDVDEVARLPGGLTPVPGAPASLLGVLPWRGRVVPIIDLDRFLGAASGQPDARRTLILVPFEEATVGIVVDELVGACRVPESAIVAAPVPSGVATRLDCVGVLELAPERLDESSHVPPAVRERCRVPIVDLVETVREVERAMPERFPGAQGE